MMVSEDEMLQDIMQILLVLSVLTIPNTQGEALLESLKKKYRRYMI